MPHPSTNLQAPAPRPAQRFERSELCLTPCTCRSRRAQGNSAWSFLTGDPDLSGASSGEEGTPLGVETLGPSGELAEGVKSSASQRERVVQFVNKRAAPVQILWVDFEGREKRYVLVPPGKSATLSTFVNHVWLVRDRSPEGKVVGTLRVRTGERNTVVAGRGAIAQTGSDRHGAVCGSSAGRGAGLTCGAVCAARRQVPERKAVGEVHVLRVEVV